MRRRRNAPTVRQGRQVHRGGVAEWFIAAVFKTERGLLNRRPRGFESHRLRSNVGATLGWPLLFVACRKKTRKSSRWIPKRIDWNPMAENKHLPVRCRPSTHYYLRELAETGAYGGKSKAAVVRFFVERGIVAALEAGVLSKVNASALGETDEDGDLD